MGGILDYFPAGLTPRPEQAQLLLDIEANWHRYDVFVGVAPTACHAAGQGVLMYDGTIKLVEDVEVGDRLMGPDSRPRTVMELYRGRAPMRTINPLRGIPWTVTHNHIMSLHCYQRTESNNKRHNNTTTINMPLNELEKTSKYFRHCAKLWKPDLVEFEPTTDPLCVDPYILGIWLGDGTSAATALTTPDENLRDKWQQEAERRGLSVHVSGVSGLAGIYRITGKRKVVNTLLKDFRELGVFENKHIPHRYLMASVSVRKQLLAGLIDTDGYWMNQTCEIVQAREGLARQILFLVRSLGFAAQIATKYVNNTPYYRVTFSGQNSRDIPSYRTKRHNVKNSKRNLNNTGFVVTDAGVQDYFGFELDGDRLYLLEDFTVTHNTGKTEIALTIAYWQAAQKRTTTYAVPNNVILDQTHARYPEIPILRGQEHYYCETYKQICKDTKADKGFFCKGCPYVAAKKLTKASGIRMANFYSYWAHKMYSDVVIFDECHQLIDMVADKQDIKLWSHLWKFPSDMKTVSDVLEWGQNALDKRPDAKLAKALAEIRRVRDGATMAYSRGYYRGAPCTVLHIVPATKFCVPAGMWPEGKISKMVMLSATTGIKDMEQLGLDNRRVLVLQTASPIPPANRPFVYEPAYNLARQYERFALPILAKKIDELLERHPDKGLIHIPYRLAEQLQELAQHPRLMWHGRDNKATMLEQFKSSTPEQGRVLVASGLYEGVDLPYDAARWQLLAKMPYLSLGDPHIKQRREADPDWYAWETIKRILQATGRIVRAADDQGTTYMCDTGFERLYKTDLRRSEPMFPKYFRDAVKGVKKW